MVQEEQMCLLAPDGLVIEAMKRNEQRSEENNLLLLADTGKSDGVTQ
jgi:hypothetical protein